MLQRIGTWSITGTRPTVRRVSEPASRFVRLGGLRLHYLDWPNETAPPILLLHGFTSHARSWDLLARALSPNFHVVALDQRGHGDSDRGGVYGSRAMVGDVERFVEHMAWDRFALLGLSMGGINAFVYAAAHPGRVERLIVVDIGPEIAPEGLARIVSSLRAKDVFSSVEEAVSAARATNPIPRDDVLRHRVEHNLRPLGTGSYTLKWDRALRDGTARRDEHSPEERWRAWRSLAMPVLLVRGEHSDVLSPEIADRMLREQPRATLATVEGSGHSVSLDRPEGLERAVREWLGV